jgi:hypothetical protein
MISFELADARSGKFKRRTSRLDLVKVDRRGAANHKRAQGVTTDSKSAWRAYRSAHTTLARWHLVVYKGRTRGQSKKRSPEEELEEEQQESVPRVHAGTRGWWQEHKKEHGYVLKTTWSKDSEKVKANNEELREVKKRDLPTGLVGQRNIDRYVRTTPSHLSSLVDHFFLIFGYRSERDGEHRVQRTKLKTAKFPGVFYF